MKKYFVFLSILAITPLLSYAQTPIALLSAEATVHWEGTLHDFGTVKHRVPQSAEFMFTNRTSAPVVVTEAVGSCGCTVADYTKEAIAPGEQGIVRVTYNAAQLGSFTKTVSVTLNTEASPQRLRIQGTVVE